MSVRLAAVLAVALLATAGCAPGGEESAPSSGGGLPLSNLQMIQRLQAVAADTSTQALYYRNAEAVEMFGPQRRTRGSDPQFMSRFALQQIRAGLSAAAIEELDGMIESGLDGGDPEMREELRRLRAVAALRLGEQENCIRNHSIDSCLLPIRGQGVHTLQQGSRRAIEDLGWLLERRPDNLDYRWLLNVAYMTVGEYPQGVPERWRIPPEVFESDYPLARFPDIAPAVGLAEVALSGGAVMEDLNGDGLIDVAATSWGAVDQMRYFASDGQGGFDDRTFRVGLAGMTGGLNMNHADYDNDGDADLFVMRGAWLGEAGRQPNSLLRNDGVGGFVDVTEEAGLLSFHPTQAAVWGDYDNDGRLDLFIGNESRRAPNPCELYRNNGDGTFTNVAAAVGLDHVGFVKAAAWGDYDNDGRLDLYLSRMAQVNLLFHNDGPHGGAGWSFSEVGAAAGVTEPLRSFPTWFFDYDNDGWLDIAVGTFGSFDGQALDVVVADYLGEATDFPRTRLFRNNGDGTFEDVSKAMRVDRVLLAMGANFGDLDNDGWLDMYFGTGEPALMTLVPNVMFRNDAGRVFQDVTTSGGFGNVQKGHGIAFGDLDNDGDQDIYAVMGGAYSGDVYQNILFENPGFGHRWITLRLEGRRSNRSGVGARVKVVVEEAGGGLREIHRVVGTGGSFGSSTLQLEIGLGQATRIDRVEIFWPAGGVTDVHTDLPLDRVLKIREGDHEVTPVDPPRLLLGGGHADHAGHDPAPQS